MKFIITRHQYKLLNEQLDMELSPEISKDSDSEKEMISKLDDIDMDMGKLYNDLVDNKIPIDKKRFMSKLQKKIEDIGHDILEDPNIDVKHFNKLNKMFSDKYGEMYNRYRNMLSQ